VRVQLWDDVRTVLEEVRCGALDVERATIHGFDGEE
jgi:hypothetical protein